MNEWLVGVSVAFVVLTATVAVLTRDPARQAVVLSVLGLGLALLFAVLQAPDVALSQLAVGTALTPLLILLTVRKVTRRPTRASRDADGRGGTERRERG
ncbi:Na(+)/H(+) antiporter subunit B [Streptomyces sp. NPDC017868]|uniref:Na(+)/H(+) antiporter subunit B n=1 Tax=Streptomyces sp. NPDC017868 TaxID=3365014 RepID=UPI0037A42BC9